MKRLRAVITKQARNPGLISRLSPVFHIQNTLTIGNFGCSYNICGMWRPKNDPGGWGLLCKRQGSVSVSN